MRYKTFYRAFYICNHFKLSYIFCTNVQTHYFKDLKIEFPIFKALNSSAGFPPNWDTDPIWN